MNYRIEKWCINFPKKKVAVIYNLILRVTYHHLSHILLVKQTTPIPCGKGAPKSVNNRNQRILGILLKGGNHTIFFDLVQVW